MDLEREGMQKSVFEMLFLPVFPFLNSFWILLFQPFFQLFPALFQSFQDFRMLGKDFFFQLATALFQKLKDQFPVGS